MDSSQAHAVPEWATRYDARRYKQFSLTVDVLGFSVDLKRQDLLALVVTRGQEGPFRGYEAWPGGFMMWEDQDLSATAKRELAEETGVRDPRFLEDFLTYSANGRDPRQYAGYRDPNTGEWVATGTRIISKAFLALFRSEDQALLPASGSDAASVQWVSVYSYLPWEDLRSAGSRATLERVKREAIRHAKADPTTLDSEHALRVFSFNDEDASLDVWSDEAVVERWSALYRAGLVEEKWRDVWGRVRKDAPKVMYGRPLGFDHRRMLADALQSLRVRIKQEPRVAHSLISPEFKLSDLQIVFEAVTGRHLYPTNFRRVVAGPDPIVQSTGEKAEPSGRGKPPTLYRFNGDLLVTRRSPGLNLPWLRRQG